jgi:hypothetical protein
MKIKINEHSFEVEPKEYQKSWKYINSGKWEPETFKAIDKFIEPDNIAFQLAITNKTGFKRTSKSQFGYKCKSKRILFKRTESNI